MSTGDIIALATLVVAVASAPFAVSVWRRASQHRHTVKQLAAAANRYLTASGDNEDVLAERSQARNELKRARTGNNLSGSMDRKAKALHAAMSSDEDEEGVRAALAALRPLRRRRSG